MAIKGATFDLQTVLAKYDGAMYNALSNNHDGYVSWTGSGNPITFTDTNVLTLKNGYILVHGRLIVVDGATDITLNPGSSISSGDGRLVLQIDTSRTNTQTVLNQVEILQEYKATASSWRTLSTDDINALSTGVYEVQLCHFAVSNGTSSSVVIDISTDTLIGNLQADIETLADNLEQTASDVGDLMALGLSVPVPVNKGGSGLTSNPSMLTNLASSAAAGIFQASPRPGVTGTLPIANGGTGATAKATALANLGGMPLLSYTTTDTWIAEDPDLTHIENIYAFAGKNAIVECNYTGGNYKFIAIVDWGNANYGGLMILSQRSHTNIQTWRKGGSWYRTDLPDVMKITLHATSLAAASYTRLSITASEVVSGNSFCTATTGNTYITSLPTGIYRVTLQAMFPASDGATLLIGMNGASSSSQPNFTLPIQNQKGTSMVNRFNCSGILKKADGDGGNLGIYAYSSVALSGEVTAFVTIERLG